MITVKEIMSMLKARLFYHKKQIYYMTKFCLVKTCLFSPGDDMAIYLLCPNNMLFSTMQKFKYLCVKELLWMKTSCRKLWYI